MAKFARFLTVILLTLALTPFTLASHKDDALKVKSAAISTDRQRIVGDVTVCNTEVERVRFVLEAKNLDINHIYNRKLSIKGSTCTTYDLDFTKNFAEMSNTGDTIEFVAKRVMGLSSHNKYDISPTHTTIVTQGVEPSESCGDQKGEDGVFALCKFDFLYHTPTGLRIKVTEVESSQGYAILKMTHIEWGGVKQKRIYKSRTKDVRAGDEDRTKVEITNVYGDGTSTFALKLESL